MKQFTIIRNLDQYEHYCEALAELTNQYQAEPSPDLLNLIDTLALLIDCYDAETFTIRESDPIQLLKYLMKENKKEPGEIAELLDISKNHFSDILTYKKGLTKDMFPKLAATFGVRPEAFSRPYRLTERK